MTMVNVRRKSAGEFRAVRLSLQRLLKVRFTGAESGASFGWSAAVRSFSPAAGFQNGYTTGQRGARWTNEIKI
jgi:hypothetical protein